MSTESTRHLTHRRTRFRSSTNNELGTVAEDLDLARHVYPNKQTVDPAAADDKIKPADIRPAGFIGLAFATLFLGLHQCIWSYVVNFATGCYLREWKADVLRLPQSSQCIYTREPPAAADAAPHIDAF